MAAPAISEHNTRLTEIITETPETKTFRFILPDAMAHKPGQWVMITKVIDGTAVSRPFSIATPPTNTKYIEITVKYVEGGVFSAYMCNRAKEGENFGIKGPYGVFTFSDEMKDIMLIGAGSGIVPLMCMMRYIRDKRLSTKVTLLYSSKTEDYIIYRKELESFANFRITHSMTRDPSYKGYNRRIDKEMIKEVAGSLDKVFFICGPPKMVDGCADALRELGVPPERIKTERFD